MLGKLERANIKKMKDMFALWKERGNVLNTSHDHISELVIMQMVQRNEPTNSLNTNFDSMKMINLGGRENMSFSS